MNKLQMNKLILLAGLALAMVFVSSCRKYDEGPGISFISKKQRVSNEWAFASAIENDEDVTAKYHSATLNLITTGSVDFDYFVVENGTQTPVQELGEWEFDGDKTDLILRMEGSTGSYRLQFRILELKNNSMHIKSEDQRMDWHLVSNNLR